MGTDITSEQLLAALLDAQNRCNNLIGAMFNEMHKQAQAKTVQQNVLANWKNTNIDLSQRCGAATETLGTLFESYLACMLDHIEDMDDPTNEFQIREFLDKYGQGFLQLNGLIQAVNQLAT